MAIKGARNGDRSKLRRTTIKRPFAAERNGIGINTFDARNDAKSGYGLVSEVDAQNLVAGP
jgi:hypothetical protein